MFPESNDFVAVPAHGRTISAPFTNWIGNNWNMYLLTAYDRHSNETVTLRKHATKYKNMCKWMAEFLIKFDNRFVKIDRVNLIHKLEHVSLNSL